MDETEERIQLRHPDPTKAMPRIIKARYKIVRAAILEAIPPGEEGLPFRELAGRVAAQLTPESLAQVRAIGWYTTSVKLDLEGRGEIERVPGSRPQRLRHAR